jgi:predicted MFS family arabinose efflux permease
MDARWLALTVLTAARASMGFQFQSLASVAPLLVQDLGVTYAEIGFLVGLYMLPGVVLALPGGLLGQRFGDKRLVVIGLALMTTGGLLAGLAESYPVLTAGRLLSGTGAILLNVLMSKMVTDWFAGREIALAMAVFVNSFPIGIGLALLSLGWLAEGAGWPAAFHATALATCAASLLVALAYRSHPNDGRASAAGTQGRRISRQEITLVCLAGAIWGLYNGAFTITFSFSPILLVASGMAVGAAGFLVGSVTWLVVASVQAGGIVVQRWGRPNVLMLAGVIVWGACLLLLPSADPVTSLIVLGLFQGLPVGVIMSLPAEVLHPASRGTGMGLFYTCLYIGHAGLPPVAGWLQDLSGDAAVPLYFAGALVLSILPVFAAFRLLQGHSLRPEPARVS